MAALTFHGVGSWETGFRSSDTEEFEILTVLDELELCKEGRERIELLKKQLTRNNFSVGLQNETTRTQILKFIEEFEVGRIPYSAALRELFLVKMEIQNVKCFRSEIEFLEELMKNNKDDFEPTSSLLRGILAVIRYCSLLVFGSQLEEEPRDFCYCKESENSLVCQEFAMTFITDPKDDFYCPISLDLMQNPVWCIAYEIPYDPQDSDSYAKTSSVGSSTRVEIAANKATLKLFIRLLSRGSMMSKKLLQRRCLR
ncbi:hypothetical protein LguiB_002203 [Lonicera macranthoides]